MRTYLITGGAGFIGANFVKYMLDTYGTQHRLIVLDRLTYAGNILTLQDNWTQIEFVKGDICDFELLNTIFANNTIDYVVNFAAESHVDRSIENPQLFLQTNIAGTQNLLEIARRSWSSSNDSYRDGVRFLQISTDEVYGTLGEEGYFNEQTPISPRSPYSASKASADLFVEAYIETHGLPANITRCSNNYGPYQFPEKLIPLVLNNIFLGRPLPIYGDGKHVRDWLYVRDHCKAVDLVLHHSKPGEIYNIGGHNEYQNLDLVKLMLKTVRHLLQQEPTYRSTLQTDITQINEQFITFVRDRKGHDRRYAIDPTKIGRDLGWTPETTFVDGIERTIRWYLDNRDWVNSVTSGEYQHYYERKYNKR